MIVSKVLSICRAGIKKWEDKLSNIKKIVLDTFLEFLWFEPLDYKLLSYPTTSLRQFHYNSIFRKTLNE